MNRWTALFLLLALPLSAQEPGAGSVITADGLKAHLTVLAGDDYGGRNSGFPGNVKAGDYIAAHFKKIGLAPAGEKDDAGAPTWFQAFKVGGRATRNVLGIAEGSDPVLKSEIVVVGAHYDHVGQEGEPSAGRFRNNKADPDKKDKIWNGADDNGSGTVTVLEMARAYMEGKVRAKRSILFMTFSGEEWGLIGSQFYVNNPLQPLEKIVAMINLDMVGRNGDKPMDVGGVSTAAEWGALCEEAAKGTGLEYATSAPVIMGSDHYWFHRKKIPCVHFFTGFHDDYHKQSDHVEKIDFEHMAKIGKFGLRLLTSVANRPERMAYTGSVGGRVLGIDAEELDEDGAKALSLAEGDGGIRILKVVDESAAARAGLKEGDVLIEFNGKKLPLDGPLNSMRKELKTVKDDVDVPLLVLRDGKRIPLKAVWGKKKSY